jgi:hypothetical protein
MALTQKDDLTYDQVAETIVEAANRMLDADESADIWEVASGVIPASPARILFVRRVRISALPNDALRRCCVKPKYSLRRVITTRRFTM